MDPIEQRTQDIKRRIAEYKAKYSYLYVDDKKELLTKNEPDSNIVEQDSNSLLALRAKLRGKT